MKEIEHTCVNCFYQYIDSKAYPCSMCVCGEERKDLWLPKIAEQTEPSLEQFRVGLEYHTDAMHFGKAKGESITTDKTEQTEPQTEVETMSCAECKHRPIGAEICEDACHYEPQTDCQWK